MPGRKVELTEDVLLVLNKQEVGNEQYVLRVVSWNKGAPKLEKRAFWKKEGETEYKTGKIVGLNEDDFKLIIEKQQEILTIFKK